MLARPELFVVVGDLARLRWERSTTPPSGVRRADLRWMLEQFAAGRTVLAPGGGDRRLRPEVVRTRGVRLSVIGEQGEWVGWIVAAAHSRVGAQLWRDMGLGASAPPPEPWGAACLRGGGDWSGGDWATALARDLAWMLIRPSRSRKGKLPLQNSARD